jgi:hypothetical protein
LTTRLRVRWFTAALVLLALAAPPSVGAYDPPHALAAADDAESGRRALLTALPAGARPLLGPLRLPFGAHAEGWLLALRTAADGLAVWYAAADESSGGWRLLRLRDPKPADEAIDIELRAAFAIGPDGARDLVLLETASRAAPAGGPRQRGGQVYRRRGDGVVPVPAFSARLDGVADEAQARERLAPAYARLLPPARGALAEAFAALPLRYVDLTRLERLERLQPGDPLFDVHDPAHGYLRTRGDAGQPAYVLALFRHADGGRLLAVQRRWPQAQQTWFLHDAAGAWRNVAAEVMPGYDAAADYVLPRQGNVVQVDGGGAWRWTGRRFEPLAR